MKESITVLGLIVLILLMACASTESGNETGLSLQEAIEQSAAEITSRLPAGTRVAIAAFDSEHQNLSNHIMDELSGALTGSSLEVTDRRNLDFVYKELSFQMTGDVSDETAVSIGKFLGAQYVIIGQFLKTGGNYRYRVSGINVETAVQESSSRLDVRNSRSFQSLLADLRSAKVIAPTAYSRPASPPGTAGAFLDRGILFAIRGDWELAIADFTEAIKLDSTLAAAWAFRGRALIASVSFILEIGKDFSGISGIAVDAKNITAEQKAGYNKAIADYTQAIKLNPNFAPAYKDRGTAYSFSGDYDKALADFNQALRLNPNDPTVYQGRGNIYSFQGDDTRALADYNRSINVSPNEDAYVSRGLMYARMGDFNRAIADYTHAISLNPNSLLAYTNRGNSYLRKNEYNRAIADYNKAIRLNANYDDAYVGRGIVYYTKGDYDRAFADFNQAIRLNPNNNAWAYNNRGYMYYLERDYNKAIADYEAALRIDPNHTLAKDNLEIARRARGW
jgi:tetratricopeptide (TPR) repeat protein